MRIVTTGQAQTDQNDLRFSNIQMVDKNNGWAVLFTDELGVQLFHTEDGAQTWHDISPPSEPTWRVPSDTAFYFYDALLAWIMYPAELWYTENGGLSWTLINTLDFSLFRSNTLDFVTESRGWLLTRDCCAAGNEYAQLFMTQDGGVSWELINADYDTARFEEINHDLTTSYHTSMSFGDASVGWITLSSIGNFGGLLHTEDGGYSWTMVQAPLPENITTTDLSTGCHFHRGQAYSSSALSVLLICRSTVSTDAYWYTVENNLRTWRTRRLPVTMSSIYTPFVFEVISPEIAWVSDEITSEDETRMFYTEDGGLTWIERLPLALSNASVLDFTNAQDGWVINQDGELLSTNDGGETWAFVHPQLAD